jgi:D-aminopeptidase
MIDGAPVGRELGRYQYQGDVGDGSVMVVIGTDAPVDHRNLQRMGARSMMGLARTGSSASNGSGDYAIAFSTARGKALVSNDGMSPLFLAVIEATEEAVYNSMFKAVTMTGQGRTVEALPVDRVMAVLQRYGRIGK